MLPPLINQPSAAMQLQQDDLQRDVRHLRRRIDFLEAVLETLRQRHPELFQ